MQTKADVMKHAQAQANISGRVLMVLNLNPYRALWVCREPRSYDPRTDHNATDKLYIRPAISGVYILYKNEKPAMNIAGKVPVYLDSQHVQTARDMAEKADPKGRYTFQPIDIQEIADREWYYV